MKIHQIYTNNEMRNFNYCIELEDKSAYIIDPWDAKEITIFLIQKKLKLKAIINTHEHWDHIKGNKELVDTHGCEVWAHGNGKGVIPELSRILFADEIINLTSNLSIQVLDTPGHSHAHLCFILRKNNQAKYIFTGDILFNAGVGNCHNGGDVDDLFKTIKNQIKDLENDVIVFPGHDYMQNNLQFTLAREPNNSMAKIWLEKYQHSDIHSNPLTTTMADERSINTFLRLDNNEIKNNLKAGIQSNKQIFVALRELRNKW